MKRATGLLVTLLLVGNGDGLAAQRTDRAAPGAGSGPRTRLEQRVLGRFDALVQQRLGLTDEQSLRLREMLAGFHERRRQFVGDRQRARQELLRLGDVGDLTEDQAIGALEEMIRLGEEELRLFRTEQEALVEVLTARQILQFVVMREQLHERIQNIRRSRSPRRNPPGGGGFGGGFGPPGAPFRER